MRTLLITAAMLCVLSSPALAYIGPGAGLSLLGALWGLIAAIGLALAFVLAWPVRKMLRRRRERRTRRGGGEAPHSAARPGDGQPAETAREP